MGCTGKLWLPFNRCADAAESFLETGFRPVAAEAHRTGQKLKSPAELCTVAGNAGNVKCLIKNTETQKGLPPPSYWDCSSSGRYAQNVRSRVRYWMASAICLGTMAAT